MRYLDFNYRRRLDRPAVSLRVEVSYDLTPGASPGWTTVTTDTRVRLDGVVETRRARVELGINPRAFVRLVATSP